MLLLNGFLLLVGASIAAAGSLPSGIEPCKADEKLNECILERAKTAIPIIAKGDPKFKIPSLEVFRIPRLRVEQGNKDKNFIDMTLTNLDMHGLKDAQLTDSQLDLQKQIIKWEFFIKHMQLISDYELNGKFLMVPITGKGKSNVDVDDIKCSVTYKYDLVDKKGEKYFNLQKPENSCEMAKVTMNFENLMNGNKELGDNINQMLNDNWKEIADMLSPAVSEGIISVLTDILQHITKVVPYKDVFKQ